MIRGGRRSTSIKNSTCPEAGPRIVVVGPGAIGCLFAALLTEAGYDVTLLDHRPARARRLARRGITIQTAASSRRVRVPATTDAAQIGAVDILFLCVKSYDTLAAVSRAAAAIGPGTTVVSMQNGLGNAEMVLKFAAPSQVVCGVTGHGVVNRGIGHVFHAGMGKTRIAAFKPGCSRPARHVARILCAAKLDTTTSHDVHSMIWSKLIVNAAINPLTALLNVPNGGLMNDPSARATMIGAAVEAAAVAKASGVSLMFHDPQREVESICRSTEHNISSMLQDIRRRRKTEIESITGAVVREARKSGVAVPVNRMLLEQVRAIERRGVLESRKHD